MLGGDSVETAPVGYRLAVERDDVDVHRFRALVRAGDEALRAGEAADARVLAEALSLWRDAPFTGVARARGSPPRRYAWSRSVWRRSRLASQLTCRGPALRVRGRASSSSYPSTRSGSGCGAT